LGDNIAANYADIISLYIKNRIKANNLEDEMLTILLRYLLDKFA
jgi:hypothetical protein